MEDQDLAPESEEETPTSGEGNLLLGENIPSFVAKGELLVFLPLLAFVVL